MANFEAMLVNNFAFSKESKNFQHNYKKLQLRSTYSLPNFEDKAPTIMSLDSFRSICLKKFKMPCHHLTLIKQLALMVSVLLL